jgi:hypothetical protein
VAKTPAVGQTVRRGADAPVCAGPLVRLRNVAQVSDLRKPISMKRHPQVVRQSLDPYVE